MSESLPRWMRRIPTTTGDVPDGPWYRRVGHLDYAGIRDRYTQHQTELVPGPTPFFASVMARA
jgi:hypothetical protein